MIKTLSTTLFLLCILAHTLSHAIDYKYKKVKDFTTLEYFSTVEDFESYYGKYVQNCLDNTYGGTDGIPCFIGYEIWDRELNIYYNKLYKKINKKEKELLRSSQMAWLKERDSSIAFNSILLDRLYTEPGTMYLLMRAGHADSMITPMIKNRALMLKKWLESYR